MQGIRVLVTRPRLRAEELCGMLEKEGAEVIVAPLLEITAPEDDRPLREAAQNVGRFAWVLFSSPSAVEAFAQATLAAGTQSILRNSKIAVVGPKTARAALDCNLPVTRQAQSSNGLGVYEAVRDLLSPGDEVLLPAAEEGRGELKEALEARGVKVVKVAAYRAKQNLLDPNALAALKAAGPAVVLFASPRTAEAFLQSAGEVGREVLSRAAVVAIGQTTAKALAALGVSVAAVADQPTSAELVAAAVRAIRG